METIVSEQNKRFKLALKLHTNRGRQLQKRTIVFGLNEIRRALDCGAKVNEVFVCRELLSALGEGLLPALAESPGLELSAQLFRKLNYGERSDGLILVVETPGSDLSGLRSFDELESSLIIVLESIEKPGNVGAVFRTADAVGADAVILAQPQTKIFHPNSIRSSLGTTFSVASAAAPTNDVIEWLTNNNYQIFPAIVGQGTEFTKVNLQGRAAIVFGSESKGLSKSWHDSGFNPIKIEMAGIADSLNVSVSAAVVAFEARRQSLA